MANNALRISIRTGVLSQLFVTVRGRKLVEEPEEPNETKVR